MAILSSTNEVVVMNAVADGLRTAFPTRTGFNVKAVTWQFTGATPPATLLLEDNRGNVILRMSSAATADFLSFEFPNRDFDDVEIDTISVGTVSIFLR